MSSVARLQHDRLEVTVTMTLAMGGVLLGEGRNPEFELSPGNFNQSQPRLQATALRFYEVTAGGQTLAPLRATATIAEGGHLNLTLFYPEPSSWPLKFHMRRFDGVPPGAFNEIVAYDQREKLLAGTVMMLNGATSPELNVDAPPPAPISSPAVAETPRVTPAPQNSGSVAIAGSPAIKPLAWLNLAFGAALGLGALLLLAFFKKYKRSPTP